MTKSKLEKVLEHMVNDEIDLANDMLHEHIVEAARNIYADLAEEDDLAEAELDLDDDEDLDEGYDDSDRSGDMEDDIETMEDEVEAEEHFAEDEDEDAAMDDLEGEMDMDVDGELAGDEGAEGENGDVEDAMVNVEDALDELRAAFADMMGDEGDEGIEDEVADELDDMDGGEEEDELMAGHYMEDEELDESDDDDDDEKELDESATLKAHGNVTMAGDEDGKASPVLQKHGGGQSMTGSGKPVNFAGGADEKGGKGDSAKKMSVTGPQDQGGKFDKKVAKPSNSSEKAKSNIGS